MDQIQVDAAVQWLALLWMWLVLSVLCGAVIWLVRKIFGVPR